MRAPRMWTEEEIRLLKDVVNEVLETSDSSSSLDWTVIATKLPGRTNKDCRKKWTCCLAPKIRKGPWCDTEDALLTEAIGIHGMKWSAISSHIGSRQPDQCSRRWHEVLKPNINRGRWSLYEDQMLANAVRAHGRRWTEIVERYFSDRTPIGTKNRYKHVTKLEEFRKNLPS